MDSDTGWSHADVPPAPYFHGSRLDYRPGQELRTDIVSDEDQRCMCWASTSREDALQWAYQRYSHTGGGTLYVYEVELDTPEVGRSKKLKINYRTTRQILRWSLAVLGEGDYDDLDESADRQDITGYHSFLDGAEPTCVGFPTRGEMIDALVGQVTSWIDNGVDESGIAVVARTKQSFDAVEQKLKAAGIAACQLGPELGAADGVAIGTMHRMKGLEARCVAIIDASADQIPNDYFLTPESDDPAQHARDLRIERSLLYVASTRARDDLWVAWPGRPSPFLEAVLR